MHKDLLVIGGGINGAGTAADAAGRGLSVVLCEMGDLASGTSSYSSKLIHGGLRYLENKEFGMVRQSLRERRILHHLAPHLIKTLPFVLPHCPWLRPYWLIRAGLFLYDHLAPDPKMPRSQSIPKVQIPELGLQEQYHKAFRYYDCTEDDSRLVVHLALLAQQHGAQILTRTKLVKAQRKDDGWLVTLAKGNEVKVLQVKAIVNAAGPWVEEVAETILNVPTINKMKLVKGSHIIVPRLFDHDQAFVLQNKDDRVIFLIPYCKDFTLIGTTDILLDHIESPAKVSFEEISYLCEITNEFVRNPVSPKDVVHKYAGIRPLHADAHTEASKITREYILEVNEDINAAPLISVFGGKITTYRHLAEDLCNKLTKYFPHCRKAWTSRAYLPGGYFLNDDLAGFRQYLIAAYSSLPLELLDHYLNNYGTRCADILRDVHGPADLGRHFGALLYQIEVDFLIEHEWAESAEDILWRRGKMGLWFNASQTKHLESYIERSLS